MKKDENRYEPKPLSVWTYTLPGDWTVMAGKTDADNDRLSLKIAGPDDWWFHVRGMSGSHVILRSKPGHDPDRKTLEMAAAVSAYHSRPETAALSLFPAPGPALSPSPKARNRERFTSAKSR